MENRRKRLRENEIKRYRENKMLERDREKFYCREYNFVKIRNMKKRV